MTQIASAAALLHAALQDLHAGQRDQAERLPAIARHATDPALATWLAEEAARAAARADAIAAAGVDPSGPRNLWMAGILDDAERDTRATQPGRLLDIALVGAIRKAKAAEIVAFETAIALARETGVAALLAVVETQRGAAIAGDRALADRLAALTGPA